MGNARTALFNALLARGAGGRFLLRIEDTDARRGDAALEATLMEDLDWLGLAWDGEPLRQSERLDSYRDFYGRLETLDLAYPCFCTDEELRRARRAQAARGEPPRYPGTCARLAPEERREREERGLPGSLRFRVPRGRELVLDDLVRGEQRFASDDLGDFVIRRSDGTPAFLFANAVDDALTGVTRVLRGEDHVANTPRQLLLLEALELDAPRYGHLPLVVGGDGSPLSKRSGAQAVAAMREAGWLPPALVNYLARLGHHYRDEGLMSLDGLARGFDLGHLGRSPAHFDEQQLRHWQRQAVSGLDAAAFRAWAPAAFDPVPSGSVDAFVAAVRPNCLFPADAEHWAAVLFGDDPEPSVEAVEALRRAGAAFLERAAEACRSHGGDVEAIREATGARGASLFMPLRAALTGETHGPELKAVLSLLGPERAARRLQARSERLESN